jgi:hypothetical protein
MSSLEIFRLNEQGAGWVDLSEATTAELLDLELAITFNAPMQMLCFKCHTPIPKGNVCVNHKDVKGAIYFGKTQIKNPGSYPHDVHHTQN